MFIRTGWGQAPGPQAGADFVIVKLVEKLITGAVKIKTWKPVRAAAVSLGLAGLLTGCFETKQEFTLNPDGSGKVVHECTFQKLSLGRDNDADADEALQEAVGKIILEAKGVEAWRDISYQQRDDGRFHFKGTAYFTNLNAFEIPNQTMLELAWHRTTPGAVLTLRTNQNESPEGARAGKKSEDWSQLPAAERATKLREGRAQFQQAKPMMSAFLGGMQHEVILHLPGQVTESANFTAQAGGALRLGFEGKKLLAAMEQLLNDDAWLAKHSGKLNFQERPVLDEEVNALIFGRKAPVRAVVRGGPPQFDYASEVAAAKRETEQLRRKLKLGSTVAPVLRPAQGGALRGAKVVAARWVAKMDRKENEFRPFYQEPGYVLVLQADFPGSILTVSSASILTNATANDGSSLLPSQDLIRWSAQPKLAEDQGSALIEVALNPPGPGVTGLRELSGVIEYQVADGTRRVDLGFTNLQANARGAELGAQVKTIKAGWGKDGAQQVELRLNLPPTVLKAVYLRVDALNQSQLQRRGYSGGGSSYTYTFEHNGPIPAEAQLEVEVYERVQSYRAPFKLEHLDLLGRPQPAK